MPHEWTLQSPTLPGWYACRFSGRDPFRHGTTMLEIVQSDEELALSEGCQATWGIGYLDEIDADTQWKGPIDFEVI